MSLNGPTHVDEALRLAALGYPVFPCNRNKKPLTEHGWKDATTDPDTIRRWWFRWPWANPAVAATGLLVVDLDPDSPWIGDPDREGALQTAAGAITLTPRNGNHYWYRRPPGKTWSISAGGLDRGTDVRTDGGYVVVPPGRTKDGRYSWSPVYGPLASRPEELPDPPGWLVELLDRGGGTKRTGPSGDGKIPEGKRNTRLASVAGSMRRNGADAATIEKALTAINEDQCDPPLDPEEVRKVAESISRYPAEPEPHGEYVPAEDVVRERRPESELVTQEAGVNEVQERVEARCPTCDRAHRVPATAAGKKFRCRGAECNATITVPARELRTASTTPRPVLATPAPTTYTMAPELAVTPPPLRDWTPPPAPPEPEEDDGDDEPYHDPGRRPPQRYYVRNSATGLPSARTVGTLTLIVLGLAGVGSLLAAGLAMVAVINADDKSRGLAVAVSTPMVVTTFLAFLVTVFWAGLIGTLLRIEDRLTEIASSR